jgi:hypothetical protein
MTLVTPDMPCANSNPDPDDPHRPHRSMMTQPYLQITFWPAATVTSPFCVDDDISKVEKLAELISYITGFRLGGRCDFDRYQALVSKAIKSNNISAVVALWDNIRRRRRLIPEYEMDLFTAAEFSSLETFLHILFDACNPVDEDVESCDVRYDLLIAEAAKNPDERILRLLQELGCCVVGIHPNRWLPMPSDYADELELMYSEDEGLFNMTNMFYNTIDKFVR